MPATYWLFPQTFQFEATLGDKIMKHHNLITVIRTSLTRNIDARFHEIVEEVAQSFEGGIPCEGDGDFLYICLFKICCEHLTQPGILYPRTSWLLIWSAESHRGISLTDHFVRCFRFDLCMVLTDSLLSGDDPNFRAICEQATVQIFKGRFVRYFPESLKPCVFRYSIKWISRCKLGSASLLDSSQTFMVYGLGWRSILGR